MNAKDSRDRDTEHAPRGPAPEADTRNTTPRRHGPAIHTRIAGALAASVLAATSFTACSLNPEGQALSIDASNPANRCGGLLSEQFLKNELSFTPSDDAFYYRNVPPNGDSPGSLLCDLAKDGEYGRLRIRYYGDSYSILDYAVPAGEREVDDLDWQALTIDGQEGEGWIATRTVDAFWVYPDGSGIYIEYDKKHSDYRDTVKERRTLMKKLVETAPEYNETTDKTEEYRGYSKKDRDRLH